MIILFAHTMLNGLRVVMNVIKKAEQLMVWLQQNWNYWNNWKKPSDKLQRQI